MQPLILYDGVCNLCNRWVQFVLKHDHKVQFTFAPLQGETAKRFLPGNNQLNQAPDTILLIDDNNVYTGSDAVLRIFKRLGRGWKLLYALHIVPQFLRNGVYKFIARRRYRWFGRTESCMLPPPQWKDRFLN